MTTSSKLPVRVIPTSLLLVTYVAASFLPSHARAQQPEDPANGAPSGTIIIQAPGDPPELDDFYSARAVANVQVGTRTIEQSIELSVKVIQGTSQTLSLGLAGAGMVSEVSGDHVKAWSVRKQGEGRFLDLHLTEDVKESKLTIKIRSTEYKLPAEVELTHLMPGDSVGFDSIVNIQYAAGVDGAITQAAGFVPLDAGDRTNRLQSSTGGQIKISLSRSGAAPAPIELNETTLVGKVDATGKSIEVALRGTAQVSEVGAQIAVLSGRAAVSQVPEDAKYRLRLDYVEGKPVYKLVFNEVGTFPVALDFVAAISNSNDDSRGVDFTVAASAVVPLSLEGLDAELQFVSDEQSVVPIRNENQWIGFLPATGRARLHWTAARKSAEGKLFFTTSGQVDAKVGTGLLRQDHRIDYQVLQGELSSLSLLLSGPGEILNVEGNNIVSWKVTEKGEVRQLDATLSQPITSSGQIRVRSQTPLGAFPVRVEGLRLNPVGAIRHSGFLRLTNLGSVRLEPTDLSGLTQLAPDQFPGEAIEARQSFVYRFPSANHSFTVAADRIQPEVNISQLVVYQLAETDRMINADIELDVREAPIREWDFTVPADYSVVSVTGASVGDYITATEVSDGGRNLKVIFGQDVSGRQLVQLHLEKNEAAAEADWILPVIEYPEAKAVRGNIGIVGAPGYRIAVGETQLLVETPLSYFPKPTENLQQAFRIREPGWSATMRIELLQRSVQADVFHLYSLSQETVYGSALINYFVTGAPVSQWRIAVPPGLGNIIVDGRDIRTWRREDDTLVVSLHQPVMGAYTLLVSFEEKPEGGSSSFQAGQVAPIGVQGERGFVQVVSPMQVEIKTNSISDEMLILDPLELPAEFRLLSTAPPLGTWQYTQRPFNLNLNVDWFQPGEMVAQVVEFSEASSRVSQDGELVTEVLYYVKSRGQRTFRVRLPDAPVRLWEATVNGQPVTARQADDATLIPLPGGTDPNIPVEVRLRLGKPAVSPSYPKLTLPTVFTPVLKTQWHISGDDYYTLVPRGGTVKPAAPVLRPTGFDWVAKRGSIGLLVISVLVLIGIWTDGRNAWLRTLGLFSCIGALSIAIAMSCEAHSQTGIPAPLQLSIPILAEGEVVELDVNNMPNWRVNLSWLGVFFGVLGLAGIVWTYTNRADWHPMIVRGSGVVLIALGLLLQRDGAPWFYGLLALAVFLLLVAPGARQFVCDVRCCCSTWLERRREKKAAQKDRAVTESGPVTASIALLAIALSTMASTGFAEAPAGFESADSIVQDWKVTHGDARLSATGSILLSGTPGDRFLLLKAPAVLTKFEGDGLRLTKTKIPEGGLSYIISIPVSDDENAEAIGVQDYLATFEYQLGAIKPTEGVPVLTGSASVHELRLTYDEPGWDVTSDSAVRIDRIDGDENATQVNVLLHPGNASLVFKPQARDVTSEETQFFVEASNLYLPSPGVIDGRHQLRIRTSQGQVSQLDVEVPSGLTVSEVGGPVGSWQFDADNGRLHIEIQPAQSQAFNVTIETQRGLDPLPVDATLAPLRVNDADGEVGLLAVAFGADAQPAKLETESMSLVNLGDFDASMLGENKAVLHRVYRYGAEGGQLNLNVASVAPEVRVFSKQVLSLGDERIVLSVNFAAEISRAGVFQLSFNLPEGLEVESLSGDSLHHWAELTEGDQRQIILHLNAKTIGVQQFSLVLAGPAVSDAGQWPVPRFELNEASRQTGELVVRPTTGIRLRTLSRQNLSETDPRTLGGKGQGTLAFRLLQRDWNLVLGIEKLDPWVTGQILHETTLREGQTRTTLIGNFNLQNASVRSLRVILPITAEDEINTVRASGKTVADFIPVAAESNIWEIQFRRRVIGKIQFRIEYERRGNRDDDTELLSPAAFPDARQISYFYAVRAGGRLEIQHDELSQGWQRVDWSTVPQSLRDSANRTAPALTLRAVAPPNALTIHAHRHSLAEALKLRVAQGALTTILSPTGDQLTAVDLTMEVIQRSSLIVRLPQGGNLFSIFVNGESVHSIRQDGDGSAWQFYILPGIDDRTANVRFVYTVPGRRISSLTLTSPQLNVPLENIQWHVIAPEGFVLTDNDGNLDLVGLSMQETYDRNSYLSKISGSRQVQAQHAAQLLEQANQLLQAGEQTKARWALNSVANQYALDAASNEDARVQLENLQTQQAIVALNTRRQRLFLDNNRDDAAVADNEQLRQAAADNPILQQDQLNFRPQQLSQLLRGNTTEDNAMLGQIASRLVQHQRTTEPAPQAIIISLPEEGEIYTFSRSVQVAENAPLELELRFESQLKTGSWQIAWLLLLLGCFGAIIVHVTATWQRDTDHQERPEDSEPETDPEALGQTDHQTSNEQLEESDSEPEAHAEDAAENEEADQDADDQPGEGKDESSE